MVRNRGPGRLVAWVPLDAMPPRRTQPLLTFEQMQDVMRAHKALGYHTAPAKVRATMNPSSLGYFSIAPLGLLGIKAGQDDQR